MKRVNSTLIKCSILVLLISPGRSILYSQSYLITNVAGNKYGYSGDGGFAANADLFNPMASYPDNTGNIYISDWYNSRLRIVNSKGIISTVAGNGIFGFSGDGGLAVSAELNGPMGIYMDATGNIYLADIGNERIRVINTNGIINTVAGNGTYGFSGDSGWAINAAFEDPAGICGDTSGNIYVADEFNNRVREINAAGIISTIAGCGARGYTGDGGAATLAEFYYPSGVAIDLSGNLFIADENNNCIRKVNSMGTITTIAGNGIPGYAGDDGPANLAELSNAAGVGVDNRGNIYITDGFNNRIRKINTAGIISTIAGNGKAGYTGIDDSATFASIYNPVSISADLVGDLYFANEFNNHVEKLSVLPYVSNPSQITVYPNPNQGIFTVRIKKFITPLRLQLYNVLGQEISSIALNTEETQINLSTSAYGVYLYKVVTTDDKVSGIGKLVIF